MAKKIITILTMILLSASLYIENAETETKKPTHQEIVLSIVGQERYELVCAMIEVESNWNENVISTTNDYGLMQINKPTWHKHFDFNTILDPHNNITAGNLILDKCLVAAKGDTTRALIFYNGSKHYPNKIYSKIKQRRNNENNRV